MKMQLDKYGPQRTKQFLYELRRMVFNLERAHRHPATLSPARRRKLRKD
jgi:hypothetical protein